MRVGRILAASITATLAASTLLASPARADTVTVDSFQVAGTEVALEGVELAVQSSGDGNSSITTTDSSIELDKTLRWQTDDNGSLLALDNEGAVKAVVAPPEVTDTTGDTVTSAWRLQGLSASAAEDKNSGSVIEVEALAGSTLVKSVRKGTEKGQARYFVTPTALGRVAPDAAHLQFGWPQAKKQGVANTDGLQDQYLCHPQSGIARVKGTWNLERWRPNVSYAKTLTALCNPK